MSASHDSEHRNPPNSAKPPLGGIALFGTNPILLGEMKARLRTSGAADDNSTRSTSDVQPEESSIPQKLNSVSNESTNVSHGANEVLEEQTSFCSKPSGLEFVQSTVLKHKARKPVTRRPTKLSGQTDSRVNGHGSNDHTGAREEKFVEFFSSKPPIPYECQQPDPVPCEVDSCVLSPSNSSDCKRQIE